MNVCQIFIATVEKSLIIDEGEMGAATVSLIIERLRREMARATCQKYHQISHSRIT
jgi:hypothetical protein